jgi:hypothetical protein
MQQHYNSLQWTENNIMKYIQLMKNEYYLSGVNQGSKSQCQAWFLVLKKKKKKKKKLLQEQYQYCSANVLQ